MSITPNEINHIIKLIEQIAKAKSDLLALPEQQSLDPSVERIKITNEMRRIEMRSELSEAERKAIEAKYRRDPNTIRALKDKNKSLESQAKHIKDKLSLLQEELDDYLASFWNEILPLSSREWGGQGWKLRQEIEKYFIGQTPVWKDALIKKKTKVICELKHIKKKLPVFLDRPKTKPPANLPSGITRRQHEIYSTWLKTKDQTKTAKILGVSQQRVHRVLKGLEEKCPELF